MLCDLKKFSKPQNDKRSKSVRKRTCSSGDPLGEVRAPPRYFSQESVSQHGEALLPAQGGQLRHDHDHGDDDDDDYYYYDDYDYDDDDEEEEHQNFLQIT